MPALILSDLGRRNYTLLLQSLASAGQKEVAASLSVSETTISNFKADHLERLAEFMAACRLKVVPEDHPSVPPDRLRALTILARDALDQQASQWGGL